MTLAKSSWQTLCSVHDLVPDSGVAACHGHDQIALFYLPHQSPSLFALGNYDPISKANVIARGIVGDCAGELSVASPLYKQHFKLSDGLCIEDERIQLPVYACRLVDSTVQICIK